MAWSTPLTAVDGAILTFGQWNASVRDNLLETAPAKATATGTYFVGTGTNSIAQRTITEANQVNSTTTTSTTYVNLDAGTPAVTVVTGTKAMVHSSARL